MRPRGMRPFRAGLLLIGLLLVGTYFGFTKNNPFASPFELRAAFRNAGDVRPGSPVRIAGVNVGKVTGVRAAGGGAGTVVTMEIQDRGLPVHADARAKVRPRIFLEGNYFVDLRPGSASAPVMDEGDTIPIQQTAAPVQLGQVLTLLQRDTREDLRTVLREYGRALDGEGGRGFNRALRYFGPALRNSAQANQAAQGLVAHDLSQYLYSVGDLASALDRDRTALRELITSFAQTADALASEQANLTAAIAELPRFLTRGRAALGALDEAFPELRMLVSDLRPVVRTSLPNLRAGLPFISQARALVSQPELRGLVRDLRAAVPAMSRLSRGGVELQREVRLLSSCQNDVVLPTITKTLSDQAFPANGPIYEEAAKWLPGIAGESRNFDANGQYIRSSAQSANYAYLLDAGRFLFTGAPLQGVNPPKAPQPPMRADVACETQQPPDVRSTPGNLPAMRTVRQSGELFDRRYTAALGDALALVRRQIKLEGLDHVLRVVAKP